MTNTTEIKCVRCNRSGHYAKNCEFLPFLKQSCADPNAEAAKRKAEWEARKAEREKKAAEWEAREAKRAENQKKAAEREAEWEARKAERVKKAVEWEAKRAENEKNAAERKAWQAKIRLQAANRGSDVQSIVDSE